MVVCEICGDTMKMRINGSHLKSKHGISLYEYKFKFPKSNYGEYVVGKFDCKECGDIVSSNSVIKVNHLKLHNLSVDNYNIKHHKIECECGCGEFTEYSYTRHTYNRFLGGHCESWNSGLTKDTNSSIKRQSEYMMKNNPMNDNKVVERMLSHPNSKWTRKRIQSRSDSYKKTMLKKYGVSNYFKTSEFREKSETTCLKKYGVRNAQQNTEVHQKNIKSRLNFKDYKTPSGKLLRVQGYEPQALDILFKLYDESDIFTDKKGMPKFWYNNGKDRRYFPDIFIKSENKFIEVKSMWTYKTHEDTVESKCKSVTDKLYKIDVWILHENGKLLQEYKYE
jgi:hypothetical protein